MSLVSWEPINSQAPDDAEINPKIANRQYRRASRRLRSLLARIPSQFGMASIWTLDRIRQDKSFEPPAYVKYETAFLRGERLGDGIHGWELETIANEWLACNYEPGWLLQHWFSWSFIGPVFSLLRDVEDVAFTAEGQIDIFHEIFRIMQRQMHYQTRRIRVTDFVRWRCILKGEIIENSFRMKTGTSIANFMLLGLSLYTETTKSIIVMKDIKTPPTREMSHYIALLENISRHTFELTHRAQALVNDAHSFAYRGSVLRETPVIRVYGSEGVGLICPISQLLLWRVTSGMYYDVIYNSKVSNEIGKNFEEYVQCLLKKTFGNLYRVEPELEYGKKGKKSKPRIVFL